MVIITFISITSKTDIVMRKNSGAIKTSVRVAVNSDYPNTTKEKGIQQRTGKQTVAYRFHKDINKLVD